MTVDQEQIVNDIIQIAKMVTDAGYTRDSEYSWDVVFSTAAKGYFFIKLYEANRDGIKVNV